MFEEVTRRQAEHDQALRDGAAASEETRDLLARLLEAQVQLVEAQSATERREQQMLVWTRVAGVAALLALVVSGLGVWIAV